MQIHVCNAEPPLAPRFSGVIQRPYRTTISCINCIKHYFYSEQFIEILSIKHAPCYLHDGAICMLSQSALLRQIRGQRLVLNTVSFQKLIECLGNDNLAMSNQNILIMYSNCVSTSALNSLNSFSSKLPWILTYTTTCTLKNHQ